MPPAPPSLSFAPSSLDADTPVAIPTDTSISGIMMVSPATIGSPTTVLVDINSSIWENSAFNFSFAVLLI